MILALETSTRQASLAVYCEIANQVLWESKFETDRSHNSIIFEPVGQALEEFGDQIATLAVGLGPGSYGGIRVGIAVANGLALARDWKICGISSLEAYDDGEDYLVVGDARRKSFFLAEVKGQSLQGEPLLLSAEELGSSLPDGVRGLFSSDASAVERFPAVKLAFPEAGRIAKLAARSEYAIRGQPSLEPHYLRAPYITTPKPGRSG